MKLAICYRQQTKTESCEVRTAYIEQKDCSDNFFESIEKAFRDVMQKDVYVVIEGE